MSTHKNRREFMAELTRGALGLSFASGLLRCTPKEPLPQPPPKTKPPVIDWTVERTELVSISDTRAMLTWVTPEERSTCLRYGTDEKVEEYIKASTPPQKNHLIEITGLKPGTKYFYQLSTDEPEADRHSPGEWTTLVPPQGKFLFRFATMNDIHMGTDEVGLFHGMGDSKSWPDKKNPHWRFALHSAVEQINKLDVDFVLVKGDITTTHLESEFAIAREELDRLQPRYYPLRGNHDRVANDPDDYFLKVFGERLPEKKKAYFSFEHKGMAFLCLESTDSSGNPFVSEEQLKWLPSQFKEHSQRPVLIFLHHPVTVEASPTFTLKGENQQKFFSAVGGHDNLVGIFSGHSHRDSITHEKVLGDLPCVETAATLHYPSCFNLYSVYEKGYMQTCVPLSCDNCLAWNEMTKELYNWMAYKILFLEAQKRNFVYNYS